LETSPNDLLPINYQIIEDDNMISQSFNNENVKVSKLKKCYYNVRAVKNINCEFFKGQIFVLLGNNGAGKSTFIKLISEFEERDAGKIHYGKGAYRNEKNKSSLKAGICLQDNIFFHYLTVEENMNFFADIQGENRKKKILSLIQDLRLEGKKDTIAKYLSEGQKRALNVAISLIGDNKMIFLDEPTNGMDNETKSKFWKLIQKYKEDKVIILTSHDLEETEILADRIGVMLDGELITLGESKYIKEKYPCGFTINFLVDYTRIIGDEVKQFVKKMKETEPQLTVKVITKESIILNFPNFSNTKNILDQIENCKNICYIINYTLSTTTLDDIFLKLNNTEYTKNLFDNESPSLSENIYSQISQTTSSQHKIGICKELYICSKRNFKELWRNYEQWIFELVTCIFPMVLYVAFFYSSSNFFYRGSSLWKLGQYTTIFVTEKNSSSSNISEDYCKNLSSVSQWLNKTDLSEHEYDQLLSLENVDNQKRALIYFNEYKESINDPKNSKINATFFYDASAFDLSVVIANSVFKKYLLDNYGIHTNLWVNI
jgi:ABC-type multidrug transport system ATPase subunit